MSKGNIVALDLNLDQEYIKAAVEEVVRAAIVQALGDPASIVKAAVDRTINTKVDKEGKPSTGWGAVPYLEWLASKTVEKTVREAMNEAVQEQTEALKEEMKEQISSKSFRNDLAGKFIKTVLDSAESNYKMPVSVSFEPPKENY